MSDPLFPIERCKHGLMLHGPRSCLICDPDKRQASDPRVKAEATPVTDAAHTPTMGDKLEADDRARMRGAGGIAAAFDAYLDGLLAERQRAGERHAALVAVALELLEKWASNTNALIAEMGVVYAERVSLRRKLYADTDAYKARIAALAAEDRPRV